MRLIRYRKRRPKYLNDLTYSTGLPSVFQGPRCQVLENIKILDVSVLFVWSLIEQNSEKAASRHLSPTFKIARRTVLSDYSNSGTGWEFKLGAWSSDLAKCNDKSDMNRLKRAGAKGQPCLTPLVTENLSVRYPFWFKRTWEELAECNLQIKNNIWGSMPKLASLFQRRDLLIESNTPCTVSWWMQHIFSF